MTPPSVRYPLSANIRFLSPDMGSSNRVHLMGAKKFLIATLLAGFVFSGSAFAQDPAKLALKADVEKVTGTKFNAGTSPMSGQVMFQQVDGGLQVSVEIEQRDADASVRSWEAMMKKMRPTLVVDTVKGVGRDAIFHSTRADLGALSADFDKPRVQLRIAVSGAKSPAQAKQIVVDLAKVVGPRVGN